MAWGPPKKLEDYIKDLSMVSGLCYISIGRYLGQFEEVTSNHVFNQMAI
jgi:hypothetical protein